MKFLDLTGLQYFYEKYLRPLKNAAFKDVANDLTTSIDGFVLDARQGTVLDEKKLDKSKVINNALTTEEGFALDARQGKVLKDEIDELNGKSLKLATFREKYTTNANAIRNIQLSKSDFEVSDDTTFLAVWCECNTPNPSVYTSSVTPDLRLYVANSTQSGANIPVNVFALYK